MFEAFDRREEVVAKRDEQVDIVKVAVATEAVDMTNMMHANLTDIDSKQVFR